MTKPKLDTHDMLDGTMIAPTRIWFGGPVADRISASVEIMRTGAEESISDRADQRGLTFSPALDRAYSRIDDWARRAINGPAMRMAERIDDVQTYREPPLPGLAPSRDEARAIRQSHENDNER